jgi:hypothetical protein
MGPYQRVDRWNPPHTSFSFPSASDPFPSHLYTYTTTTIASTTTFQTTLAAQSCSSSLPSKTSCSLSRLSTTIYDNTGNSGQHLATMSHGKLFGEYKKATDDVLQWLRSLSAAPRSLGLNAHLKLAKEAASHGTSMPPNIADDLRIAINRRQQTAKIHEAEDGVACSGHDNVIRVLEDIQQAFFPIYECERQQLSPAQYPPPQYYIPMTVFLQQTPPQEPIFGSSYQIPHLAVPTSDLAEQSAQPFTANGYECNSTPTSGCSITALHLLSHTNMLQKFRHLGFHLRAQSAPTQSLHTTKTFHP